MNKGMRWQYSQSVRRLMKSKRNYTIAMKAFNEPIYEFEKESPERTA
jgi:hypothetical protein